ncbi:MAG TPA: NADPH:quinone oxidoreductase family protein [Stellaceae bacterium]|nr:NADPH:quinone oxidoreductase family protein [Stellaceae bacterium]
MKAVVCREFGPPETLRLEDWPDPVPGPGQVAVAARAIGVNYPDVLVVAGRYQLLPPRPFVPGKELAGIVAAVGPGVDRFRPGDRVLAELEHGAFAEVAVANAAQCYSVPDAISFEDAAAMGIVYQTAYFALMDRAQYQPGEIVLVTGAGGGVGMAALQLAKARGAVVLAGVTRPERAAIARAAGADAIIDLGRPDLRDSLRAQVREATGGRMADIVLDPAGGDVFDAALRALAWRGRLVVIGFAAGRIPEVRVNYLLVKNIAVSGLQWSDYRDRWPERVAAVQAELFALRAAGALRPAIAARLPLAQCAHALARLAEGAVLGKIVLTVAPT